MTISSIAPALCASLTLLLFASLAKAQSTSSARLTGEQVYRQTCIECHGPKAHHHGAEKAPRFGNRKAWRPLIAEGQSELTAHAWVGVRGMPARGGNDALTLEEFARATAFMVRGSGGNWPDPDEPMLALIEAEEKKRRQALARRRHAD